MSFYCAHFLRKDLSVQIHYRFGQSNDLRHLKLKNCEQDCPLESFLKYVLVLSKICVTSSVQWCMGAGSDTKREAASFCEIVAVIQLFLSLRSASSTENSVYLMGSRNMATFPRFAVIIKGRVCATNTKKKR